MLRRPFELLLVCPLLACASTPKTPAPSPLENRDPYTYHVTVPSVPADASQLVLTVESKESKVWPVSVRGLVGNAPFEVPLSAGGGSFSNEQVSLSLEKIGDPVAMGWKLQVTTHGKPVELGLRLSLPKESAEIEALEGALVKDTRVSGGGHPIEAVMRLERAR